MLASLAGLALICTALAFVLFFQLIAEVGPARATVITYVNPAVAVALGVGVLGEPLTPEIIAAFGLILAGRCWPPGPARLCAAPRPGRRPRTSRAPPGRGPEPRDPRGRSCPALRASTRCSAARVRNCSPGWASSR